MSIFEQVQKLEEELERYKSIESANEVLCNDKLVVYCVALDDCELTLEELVIAKDVEDAISKTVWSSTKDALKVYQVCTIPQLKSLLNNEKIEIFCCDDECRVSGVSISDDLLAATV